jgi:hypothetical protein
MRFGADVTHEDLLDMSKAKEGSLRMRRAGTAPQ